MKNLFFLFLIGFVACKNSDTITNRGDYEVYLVAGSTTKHIASIDREIEFWNRRLEVVPDDIISRTKVAGLLQKRFSYSGSISELHRADSLYKLVNEIQSINSSGTFRALATNCVTQHKFRQAQLYIDSALSLGDDKYLTVLMEFDIALELGNISRARKALHSLVDTKSFDYLIRAAKFKDHVEGNLDEAIILMEKASEEVSNNETLYLWTKSNLADMYSHANRFRSAYQSYLEVLARDKEYYHALKGIAWLTYSADNNTNAAKDILVYLANHHPIPDYDLLLAEIAEYENNQPEQKYRLQKFLSAAQAPEYGDMYNKYLFHIKSDILNETAEALSIAKKEVENRPTPEAYSWLAWAYLKNGDINKAAQLAKACVEKKSFEPQVSYRLGIIYKNSGQKQKAKRYLSEAHAASFELGPVTGKQIDTELDSL